MSKKYSLLGDDLMVTDTSTDGKELRKLDVLHDVLKRYNYDEQRREPVDTNHIEIFFVQSLNSRKLNALDKKNYAEMQRATRLFADGKSMIIPYVIMYKDDKELIVCELKQNEKTSYWKVIRDNKFSYRELNYLIDTLRSAGVFIIHEKPR